MRVGLTGGIATGKSYVTRRLAAAGLPIIDADRLAREAVAPVGAADCANDRRYHGLFCAAPLNAPGGAGSPANALAMK